MNSFDLAIYDFIMSFYSISHTLFFTIISSFASTIVIVTGILSIFILFKDKKYFLYFSIVNLIGIILNLFLKNIIKRNRPSVFRLTYETGYSFPSAHAMMSMIFYGLIIYFICTKLKSKKLKIFLTSLLSLLIFLIGISRIYLGVHYASDVIGGFIIGFIYLILVIKLTHKKEKKRKIHEK